MATKNQGLTLTIFGGTGDLAENKLLPSLFDLYLHGLLPKDFRIIGFARRYFSHKDYRQFVIDSVKKKKKGKSKELNKFVSKCFYHQGDLEDVRDYISLSEHIGEMDDKYKHCSNKLFHLAVPPELYESVFSNLSKSGMTVPCFSDKENEKFWTRILVEKPFGKDLKQSIYLDKVLGKLFRENQIFRIDHYLAKETVQNILAFRFANTLFAPLWNKDAIESVNIRIFEEIDVSNRGAFFDGVGALRDVGQNHLLQMLALIAMEDPMKLSADSIRKSRLDVLRKVKPFSRNSKDYLARAQYSGYLKEKDINKKSKTETYFKAKLRVDTERFKNVPFFIENGKALNEKRTDIEINFKEKPNCMCPKDDLREHANKLVFSIQPNEGISVKFWVKKPGFNYDLEEKVLSFNFDTMTTHLPDAYEKVLYDCIKGDQMLFLTTEEVKAQWKIITPIYEALSKVPLVKYKKGIEPSKIKNNVK